MSSTFHAVNPATGQPLAPEFRDATAGEINARMTAAARAALVYRRCRPEQVAGFLDTIARELEALGDELVERAHAESGLPVSRLRNERERTISGVRMFADLAREGSWVNARIDVGDPSRKPAARPDLRAMLIPIGPVVVFGASNFPLAISVAGNDTVGALAAGCPVVVKAHPAHPGTSDLVAGAIDRAVAACGMPAGVFSMVHGASHEVGLALVRHPEARAIAFTGSLAGGRALFDAAAARAEPIPVYAEMGSINPVILLPGALAAGAQQIGAAYIKSVTMGVGQYCTNPGLVLGVEDPSLDRFVSAAGEAAANAAPATMLHPGIREAFMKGVAKIEATPGVKLEGRSRIEAQAQRTEAPCVIFSTTADVLESQLHLSDEVFGPTSAIVKCRDRAELERVIGRLTGHLTASVHGTAADLEEYRDLIAQLESKVGRIIFNGFGTGLEVCASLHHGGPYPATTDSHFTSIGQAGILRFARPLCYQNFPQEALPEELRDDNPRRIWRLVDGELTREAIATEAQRHRGH
jgi:NADP-dependent aldehyde dehydrogenase